MFLLVFCFIFFVRNAGISGLEKNSWRKSIFIGFCFLSFLQKRIFDDNWVAISSLEEKKRIKHECLVVKQRGAPSILEKPTSCSDKVYERDLNSLV